LKVNRKLLPLVVPLVGCYELVGTRFVYLKEETSWLSEHKLSRKTVLHRVSNLMIICVYVFQKLGIIFIIGNPIAGELQKNQTENENKNHSFGVII
jgi:hypothetical protein